MLRQLVIVGVVGVALGVTFSSKVDISLESKLHANIAVSFTETTDNVIRKINSIRFATRGIKILTMKTQLEQLAATCQRNVINFLEKKQVNYKSTWINNHLYVEGASAELIEEIASFPEVVKIREQIVVKLDELKTDNDTVSVEWGIEKIEAPKAWALPGGNNGIGIVVGIIDSGSRYTHLTLRNSYKSQYGWYDPINGKPEPYDKYGHGTHVTGTIAGSHGIGVAPGAKWISCKAFDDDGSGKEVNLITCGGWITCPDPECNMIPDVCSNSWGLSTERFPAYVPIIEAWHAAGIIPVFSIGNNGPTCRTTKAPGDFPNVIGVGATDSKDMIVPFSSKGPALGLTLKPDITAPGFRIRSAGMRSDTAYLTASGTSMATPHVSAVVALLKSRNRNFTFNQIKDLLQNNCDSIVGGVPYLCGCIPSDQLPNNIYGHGRVNALASLTAAIHMS